MEPWSEEFMVVVVVVVMLWVVGGLLDVWV
jgi:hypothetical protein